MARAESKAIMGYLPIEVQHHAAIISLVAPATPAVRLLDPFAGEGEFLEAAANAWQVMPYANELDGERAAACVTRFGPLQAVRCDVERLSASTEAFGILWANPPYDHDALGANSKRIEFAYLRHSWKWAQVGAIVFWVVYQQHITEEAVAFLSKHSSAVDVWALPGKHLGEYHQVVVVAIKGTPTAPAALYQTILAQKLTPRPLLPQPTPVYRVPAPPDATRKFIFAPDIIDAQQGLQLVEAQGAWQTQGFQALLDPPLPPGPVVPIVPPRPGHMALVLAAGVADGAVIYTDQYGTVAVRGKTTSVEQVARIEREASPQDPARQIIRTTMRLKPTTMLTLLAADGTVIEMEGDSALLDFITRNKASLSRYLNDKYQPLYQFDFNGLKPWLDAVRLKGKYPIYTAQKHVISAITRGFEARKGILLAGQMGVGKTLLGSSVAIAMLAGQIQGLRTRVKPDQVALIVAPPHLIEKWEREIRSIRADCQIRRLDRHEDVKAFMDLPTLKGVPKIGMIKRDMTKLGGPREVAVQWKFQRVALWRYATPVPEGYLPSERIRTSKIPTCPTCGATVMQTRKDTATIATVAWLKAGKRECAQCITPLWRDAREQSAALPKNPRYRLDMYLKQRYPRRVQLLIWDEAHEAAHADTGNGESFARMAGMAEKVLAMTGTPFNGRSSSLFNLDYTLNPRIRERFPRGGGRRLARKSRGSKQPPTVTAETSKQRGRAESRWVAEMGVREQVHEERPTFDRDTGVFTGTTTYERPYDEAPGISPLLVAEMLDHAVFFSLADLGKALPSYEEVAVPVALDADALDMYQQTRQQLIQYLVQRRWEGDTTFRGAYLHWAMGWPNTPFRPYEIIHNVPNRVTGEKTAVKVAHLPSFGEERVYAKEQALIDLVKQELAENRPVVIFIRQTATRDIQPRIASLICQHVPLAKPFILKNTVEAERRERVIAQAVAKGTNVILSNPDLVRTGLDLVFAPSLIFYELTFNLSTMMQAAGRSYRLNQTHKACKTYYLFAEDTMEHTAVHLMSRKQRAAKILNGDIGLTGLDALTEGESSFEQALLDALTKEDALIRPADLFRREAVESEVLAEDSAYWNVERITEPELVTANSAEDPLVELLVNDYGGKILLLPEHTVTKVAAADLPQPAVLKAPIPPKSSSRKKKLSKSDAPPRQVSPLDVLIAKAPPILETVPILSLHTPLTQLTLF